LHLEFLEKAKENLSDAEDAFKNGRYNACGNRAYFASYQAAIALLVRSGTQLPSKLDFKHSWMQANFVTNFIKRKKVFSSSFSNHLNDLRSREIADYRPESLSKKDAKYALNKANEFCKLIAKEILGNEES